MAGAEQADVLTLPAEPQVTHREYPAPDIEPEVTVEAKPSRFTAMRKAKERLRDRARQLVTRGYLPATSQAAINDPRYREGIEEFWQSHYAAAEQSDSTHTGGSYELMPDDYTPGMGGGRSITGHRRTHRMGYTNSEVALRMPSATAIRRFSAEKHGRTFDVPVEATYPGGSVSGYVRVTNNGPGEWSVEGLGMDDAAKAYVSESVRAVLEARCVSRALSNIPDILAHRAERLRAAGVGEKTVTDSDWIRTAGYNRASGDMVVNLGGRMYGYRDVPREDFERIMKPGSEFDYSAGKVYNALVKRKRNSFAVEQCAKCGRFSESGAEHRCPSQHKARQENRSGYQNTVRAHLIRQAAH